jgi:membrane fusion protein, multidrug efflux system
MRIQVVTFRTFLLATTGIAGLAACGANRDAPPPRVPVSVARVERRAVPYELDATGTVEAIRAVDVMPQVNGTILRVNFREGDEVASGQVLFEIDPRPYRAALQQSEATLLRDLTQAQSAAREAARYRELATTNTVTQEDYEQKQAAADAAVATVRSDSAAASLARLNLEYATVRAPIPGRTGRLLLHEGNVVRAGSSPLVSIVQIRPILVRFPVPAVNLPELRKRAGQELVAIAMTSRDSASAVRGVLSFVDNQVDPSTGSVLLKARFPNTDKGLWPGEFVSVTLVLGQQQDAIVVPSAAVMQGQQGTYVFVVNDDGTATTQPVTVERTLDSLTVLAGIPAGALVVTDGQLRLTPNAKVDIRSAPNTESQGVR